MGDHQAALPARTLATVLQIPAKQIYLVRNPSFVLKRIPKRKHIVKRNQWDRMCSPMPLLSQVTFNVHFRKSIKLLMVTVQCRLQA